ncbi:unnamed protein product [Coregonus sp. 'balchen']|nr:unnamed protein product [Coregonus sp. 'balchen']
MPAPEKEERREESVEERREERREEQREERREERKEERREERSEERCEETMEMREERKEEKLPPPPISFQKEEKLMPRPQPMQIEYKAVSWRENKNKTTTTSNRTDRETSRGKPKVDSLQQVSRETTKEPEDPSDVTAKSCATEEVDVIETESNQHKTPVQDTVKTETGNTKVKPSETESPRVTRRHRSVSESSDKPELVRRDTKPPMLGSSPKLPSKDKEVSSASLVLQDGSNKPKSFSALATASPASPAPASPTPASPAPAPASPAPAPTLVSSPGPKASPAPASPPAPTSSSAPVLGTPHSSVPTKTPTPTPSHSVSMLVKEKGYQADIGSVVSEAVSEEITRSGGGGVPRKHINIIEIPLQTRGSSDGSTSDSHRQRTYSSSSTSSVQAASSVSSSSTVQAASSVSSSSTVQAASSVSSPSTVEEASSFSSTSVNASTSASSSVNASTSASSFSSSAINASASSSYTHSVPNSPRLRRVSSQMDDRVRTTSNQERVSVRATVRDIEQRTASSPPPSQKKTQEDTAEKETVKKSTYSPKLPGSPALMRRYRPQVIEVRSLSKEIHKQDKQEKTITSSTRPQTIEVHSIANGPPVAPKPKFRPTDANSLSSETQQKPAGAATSSFKQHTEEERPVPNEKPSTSATTIHRHLSNDLTPASNYNKKLSVSAVSSYRPPPIKTTIIASFSHKPASTTADTETSNERPKQPGVSTQGQGQAPIYTQRPTTLTVSAPAPVPAPAPTQAPAAPAPAQVPTHAHAIHSSQSAVVDITSHTQEQTMPVTFNNTKQPATVSTNTQVPVYRHHVHTQAPIYTHHVHTQQPIHRSLSSDRPQRADDLLFYASDDPPSYDERESFSPLHLPDLPQRKLNRYHPSSSFSSASSCPAPCSCTSGCPSHGLTPPHHHHSPHTHTPPFPTHSPGQALSYSMGGQPALRPHQCRADPQPLSSISYQPSSPKSSTLPSTTQPPPVMYQSLHQPHPSMLQPCPADRPLQHPQHMDPRRAPPLHRSPQGQPPVSGGPYSDQSHSPNLPPMDPQYLCSPQSLGPSYGSEYGSLSGSDYPDSTGGLGYRQTPRRVLMDPDTGKYFYIEVPVQPLRKMLFDPETGQYVEVLIPQSTMSHSDLYPPSAAPYSPASAAPYSSIHNPNMYAPSTQYLPYGPPPPAPHPQSQPQPPRHPEAPAPGTMHQNGAQVGYGSPGSQGSKPEPQSHAPLDQSYLESMYYVPTGMNASPPDCYYKQPSSLPNAGGKRA